MHHVFALREEDKLQEWGAGEFLHCDLSYADICESEFIDFGDTFG
jgi:hypothetical protein